MAEGSLRSAGELTAIRGRSRPALDRWVTPGVPCPPFARWERLNRTAPGYRGTSVALSAPGAGRLAGPAGCARRASAVDIVAIAGKLLRSPARGLSLGGGSRGPG